VNRDNTVSFQNLTLQIEPVRWRGTLAGCTVIVHQHLDGVSAMGRTPSVATTSAAVRSSTRNWRPARPWKSPKADFPTALGNPAKCAGFPLSHRLGGCGRLTKTGHFTCYEKRTF
jgi:hypothetical protein